MKILSQHLYLLILLIITSPFTALAKHITLIGDNNLTIAISDPQHYTLKGTYSLNNTGNDTAYSVFISLRIGTWSYASSAQQIGPGEKILWNIQELIEQNKITCGVSKEDSCNGLSLPPIGEFPLRITHHYRDVNGYEFSAALANSIEIGDLTDAQRHASQISSVRQNLVIVPLGGNQYTADITIFNTQDTTQEVAVIIHLSREFSIDKQFVNLTIPAHQSAQHRFILKNEFGLLGSVYGLVSIIQGSTGGVRTVSLRSEGISIEPDKKAGTFFIVAVLALLGIILMMIIVYYLSSKHAKAP